MLILRSTLTVLLFPLLSFPFQQQLAKAKEAVEIKGIVISAETGKPIPGIYLYVTEGEEEALTDRKGEFRIRTWKPVPLILTSQNQGYHTVRMKVTQPAAVIMVRLRKK